MSAIKITFPGGKKINAHVRDHIIQTDQSVRSGGENSAPAPYDLFLASLATCAGIYVQVFCESRRLSTDGIEMEQSMKYDPMLRKMAAIVIDIKLPDTIPAKYKDAITRSAEQCAVKITIQNPPEFIINTTMINEAN